jgi:carbon monoxide dehydrogenase subunit G
MELRGEYTVPAGREAIWAALNDPDLLAACIAGCEFVERISETEMRAAVAVAIGPFKSRFSGTVVLDEAHPPRRWTLRGEGRGRPSGKAEGTAIVELVDTRGGNTTVSYIGSVEVGGKLADIVDSRIEAYAREAADTFFTRLAAELDRRGEQWVDQLDHSPAAVQLGDEPGEGVVVDKAEIAGETAEGIEGRLELAAGREVLGGPYNWGLLALVVVIIILAVIYY